MTIASSSALPLRWTTTVDPAGTRAAVTVVGEFDRLTAPLLHDHLLWLAATRPGAVALDLSCVVFIDLGGHEVLRRVGRHFMDRAVPISLVDPSPPVQRLLDLLGWPILRQAASSARPARANCRRRSHRSG